MARATESRLEPDPMASDSKPRSPASGSVESFLFRSATLAPVAQRLHLIGALQHAYQSGLPAWLTAASRVADFDRGVVLIVADHGAAATELRQSQPTVLARLQRANPAVSGLRIAVNSAAVTPPPPRRRRPASASPARALDGLARRLPDGNLRGAVQALARHHAQAVADQHQTFAD